jgi:hypothetical protein
MIAVFAGRRIDLDLDNDATERQFPLANVERVRREIEQFLRERSPSVVVGSAACGGDLLVLEVASQLGIRRRVILPFDRAQFRTNSVIDRPGDWGSRFDRIVADVAIGDVIELRLGLNDPAAYEQANAEIFRQAEAIASLTGEAFRALVLWNGRTRPEGDLTETFLTGARRRGWPISEIHTGAAKPNRDQ